MTNWSRDPIGTDISVICGIAVWVIVMGILFAIVF